MSIDIKVPTFAESINEGTLLDWHVAVGDYVKLETPLAEIETDKIVLEVVAPESGEITELLVQAGETVGTEQLLGHMVKKDAPAGDSQSPPAQSATAEPEATPVTNAIPEKKQAATATAQQQPQAGPAARNLMQANNMDRGAVSGSGKNNRISKADVIQALSSSSRPDERVPMTRLRQRIAERLLDAKQSTAMLTTFNEVDMQPVMDARRKYKDLFEKTHDIKLGFMSFFVKAVTESLKRFPAVNALIDGTDIVYHGYCDIGVAVSSERGLLVPILRSAEKMGLADIESAILDVAMRARNNQITLDDLQGGTFSITNGGIFGSLLSTPILNPPQSAILGMHSIQKRPVVVNDEIVIRPMMYLALSYDHRIIDGKDAVSFLKHIKELVEDPMRIILEV